MKVPTNPKRNLPTPKELEQARADVEASEQRRSVDSGLPATRGPASKAEIEIAQHDLNNQFTEKAAARVGLSVEEYGVQEKEFQCPSQFVPESLFQLVANQPRLIQNVDTLSRLRHFCAKEAQGGDVTLKSVRKHLRAEIDSVIRYLVVGLGYKVISGRPRASDKNKLIRYRRAVSKAIVESMPLVKYARKSLYGPSWDHHKPSVRRSRQEALLKKTGYSPDQIRAFFEATASKKPTLKLNKQGLDKLTEAVAIQLVAIREGLPDPEPVYRAFRHQFFPDSSTRKKLRGSIQEIAASLQRES